LSTVARIEQFVAQGGRVLAAIFLPGHAFGQDRGAEAAPAKLVDVSERMAALFGQAPGETQARFRECPGIEFSVKEHGRGKAGFLRSYALARQLPMRLQEQAGTVGRPESPHFVIEPAGDQTNRYFYAAPGRDREEITGEVNAERDAVRQALSDALRQLIQPDVAIDDPEIFYLHRVKDGRDVYFLVNPTFTARTTAITLTGDVQPLLWDPATGEERVVAPSLQVDGHTHFALTLPPAGSAFIVTAPAPPFRVVDANILIDAVDEGLIAGRGAAQDAHIVIQRADGARQRLTATAGDLPQPLVLDGAWQFEAEDANALVIGRWAARAETPGVDRAAAIGPAQTGDGWLPMTPGAWSYQLPAEPERPYPINVWYRIPFRAAYLPPKLDLIVDGFAGAGWELYVNGQRVTREPVRSALDSQMKAIDIADLACLGENIIALRLTVTSSTDGLLDLLKLLGDFSLARSDEGYVIAEPRRELQPAPWTGQGYPFYSGCGVYRKMFTLPPGFAGCRVFLEPAMADDVLEVTVNGASAGVRLWAPYAQEITALLGPGENTLELRVANTPVNVLEAVERPSGLAGAPRLAAYHNYLFGELK
jgi:hypothetical protein